jgi:hypothetical protein
MLLALNIFFILHGIAHLVGFAGSFHMIKEGDFPYTTKILFGRFDIGDTGMRFVGILWLLAAIAFVVIAIVGFLDLPWWLEGAYGAVLLSTTMCLLGMPQARIGLVINVLLICVLLVGEAFGWLA